MERIKFQLPLDPSSYKNKTRSVFQVNSKSFIRLQQVMSNVGIALMDY